MCIHLVRNIGSHSKFLLLQNFCNATSWSVLWSIASIEYCMLSVMRYTLCPRQDKLHLFERGSLSAPCTHCKTQPQLDRFDMTTHCVCVQPTFWSSLHKAASKEDVCTVSIQASHRTKPTSAQPSPPSWRITHRQTAPGPQAHRAFHRSPMRLNSPSQGRHTRSLKPLSAMVLSPTVQEAHQAYPSTLL